MPTYFQRPENALKRANEFIDVGKKQRALDALYDVIKSKKHRTWQKIHEPIMEKYLQLCVELRKSHIAKEGLYQYKNICQQVNIKSLEDVVRKYIRLAESKTEAAKQESHQVVVDIDDLDNPDTPENLLLKAVSGEDTQDRTDRAILTPWVKFLWESYRQCLDLLRNNSRVERLYQDIAQQAFKFCLEYGRKTEFRKLCDNLRTHLGHIHKHQNQQTAINLNNPDSQAMHLETRLVQLDSAINMELWQEAFKAVEDIHSLILLSKKPPKPSLMANYYQKLGLVFWKSNNALFHASTLHKLFHLSREQRKNLSAEELQKMASRVLCATLAIPIPPARNAIDQLLETNESTMEKQRRLATLLMLNSPPTRQGLIKDLVKYNILQHVQPDLQNLYKWLEVEFHPLKLYSRVKTSVEYIHENDELNQYMNYMEDIIITRVIKQVSQVYQTIEFSRIAGLVPFASSFRLERVIVEAARTLDLQVRIDHRNKCLSFGTDLMVAQKEDVPEGPYIQSMPSEQIRNQLTGIASALHRALNIIQPKHHQVHRDELKANIINSYRMTFKKDHQRILQRRHIIESRKEELEHMNDQREREEMEQAEEQRKKAYDAEMARLDREAKERERQRRIEEHREIQKKHALEKIEQLKKTDIGAKVLQNLDEEEFATLDVEDIMAKQLEQLEKEKKELQERLKNQERKIDYFARAKRMEELPLLVQEYEVESKKAKEFWETMEQQRIENMKLERKAALVTQERLMRMKEDKDRFLGQLKDQRKEEFKKKLSEFEEKMKEERKKRLAERKLRRKEERRRKWLKEKEEAEQQARDEALKREREEQERIEQEKIEAEKQEYEARLAKLQEQEAKKRAREQEIEEKEARRLQEERSQREDRGGDSGAWRGDHGGSQREPWRPSAVSREGGGWREREKQRIESWKRERTPPRGEDNEDMRDRMPARDEREGYRERDTWRGSRDDYSRDRDRGPSNRDEDRFGDRAPPPREDRWGGRGDDRRDAWRDRGREDRDGDREDRWKPRGDAWRGRDDRDSGFRGRDDRDGGGFRSRDDRDGGFRDRGFGRDDRDGGFRDRGPGRDDRDGGFRDRGPGRDDRDGFRDRGLGREDRDGFRDRGPGRDDRDGFRDRGPGRDDRDGFRDRGPSRDDRDGGFRDRGSGRPERDAWRGSDRGGQRDDRGSAWRGRDDRGPPPREDRDSRGPPRDRDDREGGGWRRGGGGGGGGFSRSDRPSPREDRRDDRRGPGDREDGGSWKRGGEEPRREAGRGSGWRDKDDRSKGGDQDNDGWTTVKY